MKISAVCIAVLFYGTFSVAQTNYSKATLKKIAEVENNITGNLIVNNERPFTMAQRMAKYNVRGVSIAVIHNYKIHWAKGYGWANEEEKKPVTTQTLFEPGSISKSLNAVGILKLAQDKKLDLYTDINTYLTSWKFPYDSLSNGKKITLAHLLSHTAGLTVHGFPGHNINEPIPSVQQVLDGESPSFTPAVRSAFEPGLRFQYSGGGTTISQLILTDITKQPYEEWMYTHVLKPIGMVNSTYAQPPAEDKRDFCASGYYRDGKPVPGRFNVYPEQGAAGLWMTPSDLCNYIIDMQLAYKGKKSKVLNADMVKLHLTPYQNELTAMGTFIENRDGAMYFQHGAGNDGFCGYFYGSLDEGNGVAIFMNTDDPRLLYEIMNSVAKAYNWKNFYREPRRKNSIPVADSIIATYEGLYVFDNTWSAIGKKDNEFHFFTDGQYVKMYFETPTHFFNEEFSAEKEILKDANGNSIGYTRSVNGKEYPKAVKIGNPDTLNIENRVIGQMGWYLFENKKYGDAVNYFKRGFELYPEDLNMLINVAHAYLYGNDYTSAIAIYKSHLADTVRPEYTWIQLLQDDYNFFKTNHYDVTVFDKVFEELKIEKPGKK